MMENDLFSSGEHISRDDAMYALHRLGGYGAKPDTWDDGWEKAITAAIEEIGKLKVVGTTQS